MKLTQSVFALALASVLAWSDALAQGGGDARQVPADSRADQPARAGKDALQDLRGVIGVVDMERAKQGLPQAPQLIANLTHKKEELTKELNQMRDDLQAKQLNRDKFDKETFEWVTADCELQSARQSLDQRAQAYQAYVMLEREKLEAQFQSEIKQAIDKIASDRGILLVLRARSDEKGDSVRQRLSTMELSDVLYYSPKLDLTEDVIRILKATSPSAASNDKDKAVHGDKSGSPADGKNGASGTGSDGQPGSGPARSGK